VCQATVPTGDFDMKKLAIALIFIAAVPAIATTTASLIDEVKGQNEVVVGTMPSSDDDRLISSKSSRPKLQRRAVALAEEPLEKLSANLY
jgi:hypothetical protein